MCNLPSGGSRVWSFICAFKSNRALKKCAIFSLSCFGLAKLYKETFWTAAMNLLLVRSVEGHREAEYVQCCNTEGIQSACLHVFFFLL